MFSEYKNVERKLVIYNVTCNSIEDHSSLFPGWGKYKWGLKKEWKVGQKLIKLITCGREESK